MSLMPLKLGDANGNDGISIVINRDFEYLYFKIKVLYLNLSCIFAK